MSCDLPINKDMCSTCPFRPGVDKKYAALRNAIAHSAMTEATRICHQTGNSNAFHRHTGKPEAVCRGARDIQNAMMASCGVIEAATDEAWNNAMIRIGMKPQEVI